MRPVFCFIQFSCESATILGKYCRCAPSAFGLYCYLSTAAARAAGHVPEGGVSGRQRGILLRNICFNLRGSSRFVFWVRSCTPLPIPASVYGLILLLLALRFGIVKLEQVKEVGLFLTGIFPLLFVPAAAGVMELWAEMGNMLLPIIIAIVPVTVLVLASAGRTTQALTSRRKNKEAAHD